MKELLEYASEMIRLHPSFIDEVNGLIDLCEYEIEQGGSIEHEIESCREDIRQLVSGRL